MGVPVNCPRVTCEQRRAPEIRFAFHFIINVQLLVTWASWSSGAQTVLLSMCLIYAHPADSCTMSKFDFFIADKRIVGSITLQAMFN